jgi:hypothetical protein
VNSEQQTLNKETQNELALPMYSPSLLQPSTWSRLVKGSAMRVDQYRSAAFVVNPQVEAELSIDKKNCIISYRMLNIDK